MIVDFENKASVSDMVCQEIEDVRWFVLYLLNHNALTASTRDGLLVLFLDSTEEQGGIGCIYDKSSAERILFGDSRQSVNSISSRLQKVLPTFVGACIKKYGVDVRHFQELARRKGFGLRSNLTVPKYMFVGRTSDLERLHNHFFEHRRNEGIHTRMALINSERRKSFDIQGFGGMGKTALAIEYARCYASKYSGICWIDCKEGNLRGQIGSYATSNGVSPFESTNTELEKSDYYWQALNNRWSKPLLVIFDNVESKNKRSPVESVLPGNKNQQINVIMTSREKLFLQSAQQFELGALSPEDSLSLFNSYYSTWKFEIKVKLVVGKLLSEVLNGHPLSIALIGAYCHENAITNFEELIERVKSYGFGEKAMGIKQYLPDYSIEVYASFDISFSSLKADSMILLLLLSLFPRVDISIETLKLCVKYMRADLAFEKRIKKSFSQTGPIEPLRALFKHSIIQNVNGLIQIHEVIYDFLIYKWVREFRSEKFKLSRLECSFSKACAELVENELRQNHLDFNKAQLLSGVLMPFIINSRKYLPSMQRIMQCLDFWFDNFVFQQFIYDTELQDTLVTHCRNLVKYLDHVGKFSLKHKIVLHKMIGHSCYAQPKKYGKEAKELFISGIQFTDNLLSKNRNDYSLLWYSVFFRDHLINVESKSSECTRQYSAVHYSPALASLIENVEENLHQSLRDILVVPSSADYPLLLRAAHYWGHRGNQDSYYMYLQIIGGKVSDLTCELIEKSKEHYQKALNYRWAVIKIFSPDSFNKYLGPEIRYFGATCDWFEILEPADKTMGIENFATLYQGLSDSAHQYRCLHFVHAMECLWNLNQGNNLDLSNLSTSYNNAKRLWDIANGMRRKDEAPIKYIIWMASSSVTYKLLKQVANGDKLMAREHVKDFVKKEIKIIQKQLPGDYQDGAIQQIEQSLIIYDFIEKIMI